MRVLAAHPSPDRYGADLMLVGALRALRSAGAEVTVAVPERGTLIADLDRADVTVTVADFPVLRKALLGPRALTELALRSPAVIRRLRDLIRESGADVVYVNTLTLPHWVVAARVARVPVVCHVREAEEGVRRVLQRGLTAPVLLCDRAIANSKHTARHLRAQWARLEAKVVVVHNGFEFEPVPPRREPREPAELLLVGRLSPRKGQDVAIDALARLHRRGLRPTLRLVGTEFRGYEWFVDQLRRDADRLGVGSSVIFDGYRRDVAACNARADVVIVPSRVEPFGNVAVEALAANRPLVASAVGGLVEIVDHGETGLLVPSDDAEALADAVAGMLDNPRRAADMAQAGAVRVRDRFALERYHAEIVEVLTGAAGP